LYFRAPKPIGARRDKADKDLSGQASEEVIFLDSPQVK
jgi:hypothetical protein